MIQGEQQMNYRFLIQYDGSRYSGWQKQGNTQKTIQGKIESVLEKMTGTPVELQASGRTDAGVHAYGQVANAHFKTELSFEEIRDYLNRYLPEDIAVLEVVSAHPRFHSRLNASAKTYRYRIRTSPVKDVFSRKYACSMAGPFDADRMRRAAALLTGTHDFTSFCGNRRMKKSAVRTIYDIHIEETKDELVMWFTGDGFLQNMVRILAGTLAETGLGKRTPESMTDILEAKNRDAAGITMSAHGLALMQADYEKKI